jgi:hypothetical protein
MTAGAMIGVRAKGGMLSAVYATGGSAADPLLHHRAVVDALRQEPMAPLRFGCTVSPEAFARHSHCLRRAAQLSHDHVEIGLRLDRVPGEAHTGSATDGRSYLRRAAARAGGDTHFHRHAADIEAAVRAMAGVADMRRLAGSAERMSLAICALRSRAAAIAIAAEALATDGVAVDVSGPWPLYSFSLPLAEVRQ